MARTPQDVTDAELAILELLWEEGPAMIRQLTERLYPQGGRAHYATVQTLLDRAKATPGYRLTVDLETQTVSDGQGFSAAFTVDPFRRHCLLHGLDDIGLTLQHAEAITEYEAQRPNWKRGVGAIGG